VNQGLLAVHACVAAIPRGAARVRSISRLSANYWLGEIAGCSRYWEAASVRMPLRPFRKRRAEVQERRQIAGNKKPQGG